MYIPSQFNEENVALLHEYIRANPFATLVTSGLHGIEANHLPFLLDTSVNGRGALLGHIARANHIWETVSSGSIEIKISRIIGKWKVSQNRSEADRTGVARALEESATIKAKEMVRLVSDGV